MEDNKTLHQQLLEAGVHFGHLKKKWNPKMLPYIFAEKNGIHIIDLNKTIDGLDEAANALKSIAKSGKKIMFVATKKQAKEIVAEAAARANMPFVTERWLGGMLTNFSTIRKSVKKMLSIEKMLNDGTMDSVTKKERLTLTRSKEKMEKVLGGISQMGRVPAALFMVDISHEHIALAEAKRLGITTIAMVDTNSDPTKVDFAIPANDDATKSIAIITQYLTAAILEGLQERAQVKETEDETADDDNEGRNRGLDMNDEEGEGGRRGGGRGRGRSAGAGAGAGAPGRGGAGAGAGGNRPGGAGRAPGGPGRGPGGGSGRPGAGAGGGGSRPGGGGSRPGGPGGRPAGGGAPRPGGGR
ncbi:MAG: 30S ribosomal protein S2 [Taibaiella sp.]|nr:30S ribosomal protein S2 [Taibaiella sp.]